MIMRWWGAESLRYGSPVSGVNCMKTMGCAAGRVTLQVRAGIHVINLDLP